MKKKYKNREELRHIIDVLSYERQTLGITDREKIWGRYKEKVDMINNKLASPVDLLPKMFNEEELYDIMEGIVVMKMMIKNNIARREYTYLLDHFLMEVYNTANENPNQHIEGKKGFVEEMCCYHPNKEIRITGIEILVANDIAGWYDAYRIGYQVCNMSKCESDRRSAWGTHSYNIQAMDVIDNNCATHGNKIYTPQIKEELMTTWKDLIEEEMKRPRSLD